MKPTTAIDDFVDDWGGLLLGCIGLGALILGFRYDTFGRVLATVLALGFPLLVLLVAAQPLLQAWRRSRLALAVAGGITLACALAVARTLYPPAPIVEIELGVDERRVVDVPASGEILVSAHGRLDDEASSGQAAYALELVRADVQRYVSGELSRELRGGRQVRGMSTGTLLVHQTDVHRVDLGPAGPVSITLTSLGELAEPPLSVSLSRPEGLARAASYAALALALALAPLVDRRRAGAAIGAMIAATFAALYAAYHNPDAPLTFTVGACLFGLVVGGVAGWLWTRAAPSFHGRTAGSRQPGGAPSP